VIQTRKKDCHFEGWTTEKSFAISKVYEREAEDLSLSFEMTILMSYLLANLPGGVLA